MKLEQIELESEFDLENRNRISQKELGLEWNQQKFEHHVGHHLRKSINALELEVSKH